MMPATQRQLSFQIINNNKNLGNQCFCASYILFGFGSMAMWDEFFALMNLNWQLIT